MNEIDQLLKFISNGTSPFHVIETASDILENAGFTRIDLSSPWELSLGNSYYTVAYGTSLFAFTIGNILDTIPSIHMASAHTDQPCLRIKPVPESKTRHYLKINTEVYGGAILNTWFDRPLSIAGKVCLASDDILNPSTLLVDFEHPVLTIPSLAIHLTGKDDNAQPDKQTQLVPIAGIINDELNNDNMFLTALAQELGVQAEDILDFDLYVYNQESGTCLGLNDEMISSPRLDNLTSVNALLDGIILGNSADSINFIALYDNEEVGSRTKQGADSFLTNIILEKLYTSLGFTTTTMYNSITSGLMLSVDVAHAFHPNYPAKYDPDTLCELNAGVAIKINSSQRYATDTQAIASIVQLCKAFNIPFQKFVNRSNIPGGSTLGSIISSWIPARTVDIGVPILAMHSAREVMGAEDQKSLNLLLTAFFSV